MQNVLGIKRIQGEQSKNNIIKLIWESYCILHGSIEREYGLIWVPFLSSDKSALSTRSIVLSFDSAHIHRYGCTFNFKHSIELFGWIYRVPSLDSEIWKKNSTRQLIISNMHMNWMNMCNIARLAQQIPLYQFISPNRAKHTFLINGIMRFNQKKKNNVALFERKTYYHLCPTILMRSKPC